MLEVVVDGRHAEHAFAGEAERGDLNDHRDGFQHEQTADDGEDDFVLGCHGNRAECAAKRQRASVAHENLRRWRIEPQETQPSADQRATNHRQLARAGHVVEQQVIGEIDAADEVGDQREAGRRDHNGNDGQTIEAVGEIDRIAGRHDDEATEQHEEPAQINRQTLDEREEQRGGVRLGAQPGNSDAGDHPDQGLEGQALLAAKALVAHAFDFEEVVIKPDGAKTDGDEQHHPDVAIGQVRPQQRGHYRAREDHQPAHGGRALFGQQMGLRAIFADRLTLALLEAQQGDHPRAKHEDKKQRRDHRTGGAKGDVAKDVESRECVTQLAEKIEHDGNCPRWVGFRLEQTCCGSLRRS